MSLEGTSITPLGSGAASIPPNTSQQLPDTSETARSQGNASPADANAGKPGEEALEWAQVIELRAFGERKAWIEEKTRMLQRMPPIEVFAGIESLRSGSEGISSGLPTRAELQKWLVEHDRIEKETEIFDVGEFRKLKKFTKAAAQRNLSPADTDLIELTLTTIYDLDKLLHLLRDRSEQLDLLGVRITWEEARCAAWADYHKVTNDLQTFLATRAQWSPAIYDSITQDRPATEEVPHNLHRRGSIASIASVASDSSSASPAGISRGARFKLAEILSKDAALISTRVSSLRHSKITPAGKALDKLIDESRRPVPDILLDEQDRLESKGITELDDVGQFVMSVVMQWKKADEIYVENKKDQATAQSLIEEIEVAKSWHPQARQDATFLSRANGLTKRLAQRGNPASMSNTFLRPEHRLFPDQAKSNAIVIETLSSEMVTSVDLMKRADLLAKEYHASYEAVNRVECLCSSAEEYLARYNSLCQRLEEGTAAQDGDGSPPNLEDIACLEPTSHATFLALFPAIVEELDEIDTLVGKTSQDFIPALFRLNRPGVDPSFQVHAKAVAEQLSSRQHGVKQIRDKVTTRVNQLRDIRRIRSSLDVAVGTLEELNHDITDGIARDKWTPQTVHDNIPLTPESSMDPLPAPSNIPADVLNKLEAVQTVDFHEISNSFFVISTSLPESLRDWTSHDISELGTMISGLIHMARVWEAIRAQSSAMVGVTEEAGNLQVDLEDYKSAFDEAIDFILDGHQESQSDQDQLFSQEAEVKLKTRVFLDGLYHRVPFISNDATHASRSSLHGRKRSLLFNTLPSATSLRQRFQLEPPVQLASLDNNVRADCNRLSMTIAGAMQALQSKSRHYKLAHLSSETELALRSVNEFISKTAEEVGAQHSFFDSQKSRSLDMLAHLTTQLNETFGPNRAEVNRSLSRIRGLLAQMEEFPDSHDPGVYDRMVLPRTRAVREAEARFSTINEQVERLKDALMEAERFERERLAEATRAEAEKTEQERRAAEEKLRAEQELETRERERRAEEERILKEEERKLAEEELRKELERQETCRKEAEERLRLEIEAQEQRAKLRLEEEEREAIEAQRRELERKELERRDLEEKERQARESDILKIEDLELKRPGKEEGSTFAEGRPSFNVGQFIPHLRENNDDVFGFHLAPAVEIRTKSQDMVDLQSRIFRLRKRLRSLNIAEVVRPSSSQGTLPTKETRDRIVPDFSKINKKASELPSTVPDSSIDAELRSFRAELASASEMLETLNTLVDFSYSVGLCEAALSDFLEHLDSYPSLPMGTLTSIHVSDRTLKPAQQLSARLQFTQGSVDNVGKLANEFPGDSRVSGEYKRILQTWGELEAMGNDLLAGQKSSRPPSVTSSAISSGRSSRASLDSHRRGSKKSGSYSTLSVGGDGHLLPPNPKARRSVSGSSAEARERSSSRLSVSSRVSSTRSVSGPGPATPSSTLYNSTYSSRQRTNSLSTGAPPLPSPVLTISARPRAQTGQRGYRASPTPSEASSMSRSMMSISTGPTWARAPRQSLSSSVRPATPKRSKVRQTKKPYVANPKNKLDVAIGDVVNKLPININIEVVADTWKDKSGKYWIGDQEPKLCFCRILRSETVMVRVGGGWQELSKFIEDHFADLYRILPTDSPRGIPEEKWISAASLRAAADAKPREPTMSPPPRTPEPGGPFLPSFALSTPSGQSTRSMKSTPSTGSPLTALQFMRRADMDSFQRPETPSKPSTRTRSIIPGTPRQPAWRP